MPWIIKQVLLQSEVQKIDAGSKKCIAHAQKPFAYFKQTWLLTIRIKAKAKWFIAADQFPVNKFWTYPSSIYSWSIGHILEHDFFCLGHLGCAGSKGKKVDLRNSEQLLRVVFSTFWGQKIFLKIFKNILTTALKSYIK